MYGNMVYGSPGSRRNFLQDGIYITALRGKDSTGVCTLPKTKGHNPQIYKRDLAGADFILMPKFQKLLNVINETNGYIGHCRSATYKEVSDLTSHPFQHKHITLVHNGHINNMKEIAPQCKIDVDSAHIAHAMGEAEPAEVLPKLRGAFSLVWWDSRDNTLHFARNGERPMYLHYDTLKDVMYFASEYEILFAAASRNNVSLDKDVMETSVMKHYTFSNPFKLLEYKSEVFTQAPTIVVGAVVPYKKHERTKWEPSGSTPMQSSVTNLQGTPPIQTSAIITPDKIGEKVPPLATGSFTVSSAVPDSDAQPVEASSIRVDNKPDVLAKALLDAGLPPIGSSIVVRPKARAPFIVVDPKTGGKVLGDLGVITALHGPSGTYIKVMSTTVGDWNRAVQEGMIVCIRSVIVSPGPTAKHMFVANLMKAADPGHPKSKNAYTEPKLYPAKDPPKLVTAKVFRELVAGGCGNCSDPLFVENHQDIVWGGPHRDIPFCAECGHDPIVMGSLGV